VMCVCAFMFTVYKVDGDGELVCSGCVWNVWNVCVCVHVCVCGMCGMCVCG